MPEMWRVLALIGLVELRRGDRGLVNLIKALKPEFLNDTQSGGQERFKARQLTQELSSGVHRITPDVAVACGDAEVGGLFHLVRCGGGGGGGVCDGSLNATERGLYYLSPMCNDQATA